MHKVQGFKSLRQDRMISLIEFYNKWYRLEINIDDLIKNSQE